MNISVPMDIATRQMSIANFDPSPASGVEILGIATATCLLAFFLCIILCTGLRISCYSWYTSASESYIGDAPSIMKMSGKRDESQRPISKWTATFLGRSRTSHDGQQHNSQTPCFARPGCIARMKIMRRNNAVPERYYYTQIPPRCKPLPRKPLLIPNSVISSIKRKDTTLDMEEGLYFNYDTAAAVPNGLDDFTHPNGMATYRESKAKNGDHSGISFLHCRTTSL
ncbi:hypothetical protein F4801DRAFT_468400 [Xylaria longipes]|nr:hypothetical protein F4801DRAFT_468400 [Xylaria longipes]